MAVTERLVVQVTPNEKKQIKSVADHHHLKISELVRQAVQNFQPQTEKDEEAQLDALLKQVNSSTQKARKAVDDALSFVAESNKRIDAINQNQKSHLWE